MTRAEREAAIRERLRPEALDLITEAARVCGWSTDYFEIDTFLRWCYKLVGRPIPNTEPYTDQDDEP